MQRSARNSRKIWSVVVLLLLVAAAIVWWLGAEDSSEHTLREAGAARVVSVIAPLRLVSAMDPPGADEQRTWSDAKFALRSDAEIKVAIAVKLEEMNLPVEPLTIHVDKRQVRIEGRVADSLLRDAIEITVRSVAGVRTVDNRLEVVKTD